MTRRGSLLTSVALLCALSVPARAAADGLPVVGATPAANGILNRDGTRHYLTQLRSRTTVVRVLSASGRPLGSALVPGRFDIPVVAYDGSASGLSADGGTLVLIRPRVSFPQTSTALVVLDARTLRPRRLIALAGDFSFDAISPDGARAILIQYTSRQDPTRYRVRAIDLRTGRLGRHPIVDPHEPHESMRGNPVTRASSADGVWAYTLYDGNGHPFVHALDTHALTARCIDLPAFPTTADPYSARMTVTPGRLAITLAGRSLASIDTDSLTLVTRPPRSRSRRSAAVREAQPDSFAAALPIAAFALFAVAIVAIRRAVAPAPRARS